jgi:hypothetical protein
MRIYTLRRDGKYHARRRDAYGVPYDKKSAAKYGSGVAYDFSGDRPDFELCEFDLFTIQLRQKMYNCEIVCFELVEVPIDPLCQD